MAVTCGALAVTGGVANADVPAAGPVLQTLTYTATGPGGALYKPAGVSAAGGTAYVSNTGANVVAALSGGTTTPVAGQLSANGDHGDGGPAVQASLYLPNGTAQDAHHDLFIADSGDNVVREITADGIIHRIAGTGTAGRGRTGLLGSPALRTALNHPEGVAVNSAGDVYVADTYNHRVVKISRHGLLTTVAGSGTAGYAGDRGLALLARLNTPTGLALDARGNLYIADAANNVVRRVGAFTGIITTVAGNYAAAQGNGGLGGFSGDGGRATRAQLNDPQGVAVDGAGDLFVADTFNNAIRKITPGGTISTVVNAASADGGIPTAGGETGGVDPTASKLNTPYAVAVDPSTSDLYVADTRNSKIAEVTGLARSGRAAGPVDPTWPF